MELTSENMKFLFDQASVALKSIEVDLETPTESPVKAKGACGESSSGSDGEDSGTLCPPAKRSKGITWLSTRKTWIVRYKDERGTSHSKRFRASAPEGEDCESDGAKSYALKLAEDWLAGHRDAVQLG